MTVNIDHNVQAKLNVNVGQTVSSVVSKAPAAMSSAIRTISINGGIPILKGGNLFNISKLLDSIPQVPDLQTVLKLPKGALFKAPDGSVRQIPDE